MADRIRKIKAQATLETTMVMVVMVLLLGGIINIWLWANNQIVQRQKQYNETRVTAGTAIDNYELQWPVYTPPKLTEGTVLLNTDNSQESARERKGR